MTAVSAWRKSSFSSGQGQCVEVRWAGGVRDSKNPAGPSLVVDITGLVRAAKAAESAR